MVAYRHAVNGEGGSGRRTNVLEFDVQLTKDGHIVCMHDAVVDSTTDGSGPVATLSLQEIRALDAGYHFSPDGGKTFPYRGKGLKVLDEFASKEGLVLYFDLKAINVVPLIFQEIRARNLTYRCIVGAVSPAINQLMLKLKPAEIPCTPDFRTMIHIYTMWRLGLFWAYRLRHEILGLTAVAPWGQKVLSKQLVQAFKERQRLVATFGPWLSHEENQVEALLCGVDMLFTDAPTILHRTLAKWKSTT
eukprot:jgi/Chlat1/8220/Chrsp76S07647